MLQLGTVVRCYVTACVFFLMKLQVEIEEAAKRTSFLYTISESPQDEGNCNISLLTSEDAVCRIR